MICRKCDSVSEEEALTRDFSVSQIGSKAGFTVEKAVIEAKGLCHSCAELAQNSYDFSKFKSTNCGV